MCAPALAALQMVGSVMGTVMQFQQQTEAANAQNQANAQQRTALLAEQDRARMDAERQAQQQYERDAAETNAYAADHLKSMSTLDTILGEGGGGNTGARKVALAGVANGQDLATLASNSTKAQSEIRLGEAASINSTRTKSASIRDVSGPSPLGAALQIGGAGLSYGKTMNDIKAADALKLPKG